jgi:hypothetical protein
MKLLRRLFGKQAAPGTKPGVVLFEYSSYEEYRAVQEHHNRRKLHQVWADERTLGIVADRVLREFEEGISFGLCHGSRNGFEQRFLRERLGGEIIGTDISETATEFLHSEHWDFHDLRAEWEGRCDFVYSNSLDQSWKPEMAVRRWFSQLRPGGLLFIEHTRNHGPDHASVMDPFGADPELMPYLLVDWLGMAMAMEIVRGTKANKNLDVWLFVMKRLH